MTSLEMKNVIQNTKKGELLIYLIIWLLFVRFGFFWAE
jgi:hypothetical protein